MIAPRESRPRESRTDTEGRSMRPKKKHKKSAGGGGFGQQSVWEKELDLVEELADASNKRLSFFWDCRRRIVEKIGFESGAAAVKELEYAKKILYKGTRNPQAWLYREWIIRKFDKASLWRSELCFCHEILEKDIFNVLAWDQICRAVRELNPDSDSVLRDRETECARKAIYAQPGNEGPWIYLRFLYAWDTRMLYKNPELERIFVNVLDEEANRLTSVVKLNPFYDMAYALVDSRGCVHALNLVVDLITLGYKADQNTRLLEAVDVLFDKASPDIPKIFVPVVGYLPYGMPRKTFVREVSYVPLGMSRKIFALMHSLGAPRIRYCCKYRGHRSKFEIDHVEHSPSEYESMHITPQSSESFKSMFEGIVSSFSKHAGSLELEELCKKFEQTCFQKGQRQGIAENALEFVKWDLRRFVVQNIGARAAVDELQFTTDLINKDANNHFAWSHRQWVFQTFGEGWGDEAELDFCKRILKIDSCNSFAWDERFFVLKRGLLKMKVAKRWRSRKGNCLAGIRRVQKLEKVFGRKSRKEVVFAKKIIAREPENPFPWCHMFGVTNAYDFMSCGPKTVSAVVNDVLRVLEAKDCWCMNARGVTNALNFLLDIKTNRGVFYPEKEEQVRRLNNVMKHLCPDPTESDDVEMVRLILKRKAVAGHGLLWKNAADEVLFGVVS